MKLIEIRENGRKRVATINNEPSLTDQQWQKSCDVNEIIKKYKKTGQITHTAAKQGVYADYSELPDLLTALNTVSSAAKTFETMPAELRKRFDNDPVQLYNFLQDSKNDDEAIKLGLKIKTSNNVPIVEETQTETPIEKPKT